MGITASQARKNLFPFVTELNDDRSAVEITSRRGDAVLLSRAEFDTLQQNSRCRLCLRARAATEQRRAIGVHGSPGDTRPPDRVETLHMGQDRYVYTLRTGSGRPLVLVPGVGADTGTWSPVLAGLEAHREVVRLDLPGFGQTPMPPGEYTLAVVADALEAHLRAEDLVGADLVGSSMGARLVLEMARRGVGRSVVALDPGGFWSPTQKKVFGATLTASVALVRALRPALPTLLATSVGRTALLAQLSARPWAVDPGYAVREVQGLADAPGTSPAIRALSIGPDQQGAPAGSLPGPVLAVWGAQDRVTLPSQARTFQQRFPDAIVEVWKSCGHFPHWDQPTRVTETILRHTA